MKTRNAISLRYAVIYGAAWNIFKLKKPMDIDRHADHQIGAICQWAVIVIMLGFIVEKVIKCGGPCLPPPGGAEHPGSNLRGC